MDAHNKAKLTTADIKNHYLQSPIKNYQYIHILLKYFTQEIRDEYNIMNIVNNNYVYIETRKGVYVKESGILAFNYVIEILPHMDTIWYDTRQTCGNTKQNRRCLYYV